MESCSTALQQCDRVDDDSKSIRSETSTIVDDHEPFETYQEKIKLLIQSIIPHAAASGITITRIRGGGFNRVVAVDLKSPPGLTEERYIVRSPRDFRSFVAKEAPVLKHLFKCDTLMPTPEVVYYDVTADNPIQSPYMLMRRIEGEVLDVVLDALDQPQRLSMARNIARLIAQMHSMHVPPGIGPLRSWNNKLVVGSFNTDTDSDLGGYISPQTLREYLAVGFKDRRNEAAASDYNSEIEETFYDDLIDAIEPLLHGFSTPLSGHKTLHHNDFAPRNILVRRNQATSEWEISGIIDWDGCQVTPVEVAYLCPTWLWPHPNEDFGTMLFDETDWDPDFPVYNDECGEVKKAFVDEIEKLLPGFMDVVRRTREWPVKKLWRIANEGLRRTNEDFCLVETLLEQSKNVII